MQTASYGSWESPITSDLIVAETIVLDAPCFDGDDIYWAERRPAFTSMAAAPFSSTEVSSTFHISTTSGFTVLTRGKSRDPSPLNWICVMRMR